MRRAITLPPPVVGLRLALRNEPDILNPGRPKLIHRPHHRAVIDPLIGLDEDDLVVELLTRAAR